MGNNIVVGIGEALWDCLPEGRKIGGAPANFAYHISQFGLKGCAVSAVGKDALGQEILDVLASKNVGNLISAVDYPTGTVQVKLSEGGIPQYDIMTDVAWDNIPFTDELAALAKQTKAVCWGSLAQRSVVSRNTICKFIAAMPFDSIKVFDINLRQSFYTREIIENSFRMCDILKINDEELCLISKMIKGDELTLDTLSAKAKDICTQFIKEYGIKMLILTCGTDGSYVFSADGSHSFQPTPKVKVADTVGAGDSFTGSFIASLLLGKDVAEAHKTAVKVSAFVCTQNGAMPTYEQGLI